MEAKNNDREPANNLVNRSEFARLLGCTPQAIMYAEREGMITQGRQDIEGKPMYNVKQAAFEWSRCINPTLTNEALVKRLFELADRASELTEAMSSGNFDEEMDRLLNEPFEIPDFDIPDMLDLDAPEMLPMPGGNIQQLRIQKLQLENQAKRLDLKERSGALVSRTEVFDRLYAMGQTFRSKMQQIPAVTVDGVMAARTRNAALLILEDAINDALTELANEIEKGI